MPHYRRKVRRSRRPSGRPEDARRPGEIPFTTKRDLRENYPFGMFAVPREEVVRVHASSGTTGKPTVVGYTRTTSTRATADGALDPPRGGKRATSCISPTATACSRRPRRALWRRRLGATSSRCPAGRPKQVQLIAGFPAGHHHGHALVHPQHRRQFKRGHRPARDAYWLGIFGAEPWTDQMRRRSGVSASTRSTSTNSQSDRPRRQQCIETKVGRWSGKFRRSSTPSAKCCPDGEHGELVFTHSRRKRCR